MTDTPTMSPEVGDLLAAIADAQAKIDNVTQDREVEVPMKDKVTGASKGKYKFRYATLAGILTHIRGALTEGGLWYTQFVADGHMVTRLLHKSGQWMDAGHVPMPNVKGSPQDIGGVISYFKRYSLSAALGLATEEDSGEMGDREVNFRARGERRDVDEVRDVATGIEEPEGGWGDWARQLIATVEMAPNEDALNKLRDDNKRLINGAAKIDGMMHKAIGDAFITRRQAVKPSEAF